MQMIMTPWLMMLHAIIKAPAGALVPLVACLQSEDEVVQLDAVRALQNVAGDLVSAGNIPVSFYLAQSASFYAIVHQWCCRLSCTA